MGVEKASDGGCADDFWLGLMEAKEDGVSFSCMAFGFAYLSGYTAEGNPNRMILQDLHLPYPPYQPCVTCRQTVYPVYLVLEESSGQVNCR